MQATHSGMEKDGNIFTEKALFACGKKGFLLERFQFETLCVSNHTACRFAEKARFFRSLRAGRRCAAASRFYLFQR
ncbi:hypothetical protein [uncultured Desulfovibrio sp.]|uniref:hypothetical protein n=1 Tax=uncultured Desulfovibrio sp. TaxID=167968 RepID=UPI002610951A|nr:hypothetical protein [uncultured Desulfovibrio sp.]